MSDAAFVSAVRVWVDTSYIEQRLNVALTGSDDAAMAAIPSVCTASEARARAKLADNQREPGGHQPPVDLPPIVAEQHRQPEHGRDPKHPD